MRAKKPDTMGPTYAVINYWQILNPRHQPGPQSDNISIIIIIISAILACCKLIILSSTNSLQAEMLRFPPFINIDPEAGLYEEFLMK